MSSQAVSLAGVIISVAIYVFVSALVAKRDNDSAGFFRPGTSALSATISLICVNVTLGTGVAYVISQSEKTGLLAFLTPISMFIGYWLVSAFNKKLNFTASESKTNTIQLLDWNGSAKLKTIYSSILAITFVLVVGLELWLGSEFIARSIFIAPQTPEKMGVAVAIFAMVAIYTAIGGLKGAIATDVWQGILLIAFVGAIGSMVFDMAAALPAQENVANRQSASEFSASAWAAALLASATALTTPFYSVVNSTFPTRFTPNQQRNMFLWAGGVASAYYAIVIFIFLFWSAGRFDLGGVSDAISSGSANFSDLTVLFFSTGLVAITMSTLDNATMATSQVVHENILGRSNNDPNRFAYLGLCLLVMSAALGLIYFRLDAFYTLLNILFLVSVFSPIFSGVVWKHARSNASLMDNRPVAFSVVAAIGIAWIAYIILTLKGYAVGAPALHLASVAIALLFAAVDLKSRTLPGQPNS